MCVTVRTVRIMRVHVTRFLMSYNKNKTNHVSMTIIIVIVVVIILNYKIHSSILVVWQGVFSTQHVSKLIPPTYHYQFQTYTEMLPMTFRNLRVVFLPSSELWGANHPQSHPFIHSFISPKILLKFTSKLSYLRGRRDVNIRQQCSQRHNSNI